jgi:hypothetical protein
MKQGHEIQISVPVSETATGAAMLDSGPPTGPRDTFFFMDVVEIDAGKAPNVPIGITEVREGPILSGAAGRMT